MECEMRKLIIASVLAAALSPLSATAGLVTSWEYFASSDWESPVVFSGGNGTTVVEDKVISWGATGGNYEGGGSLNRSALVLDEMANTAFATTGDTAAALTNSITHHNNVLTAGFQTLQSATLRTSLTLKPFAPEMGPTFPAKVLNFDIRFKETPNNGSNTSCGFTSVSSCDDIFVIINQEDLQTSFVYDGFKYTINLIETTQSLNLLSAAACAIAGAQAGCLGFQTIEGQENKAQFGFLINAEQLDVSAPGTLGVFALGLLGLGLTARRRQPQLS
jgi:hypothetical protein